MKVDLTQEQIDFLRDLCGDVFWTYDNYSVEEQKKRESIAYDLEYILDNVDDNTDEDIGDIIPSRHKVQDFLEENGYLDENGNFIDYMEKAVQIGFEWGYKTGISEN